MGPSFGELCAMHVGGTGVVGYYRTYLSIHPIQVAGDETYNSHAVAWGRLVGVTAFALFDPGSLFGQAGWRLDIPRFFSTWGCSLGVAW